MQKYTINKKNLYPNQPTGVYIYFISSDHIEMQSEYLYYTTFIIHNFM